MALVASACHHEPAPAPPTRTDLLTAAKWRLTAYKILEIGNGFGNETDVYATTRPCQLDDFLQFQPNKYLLVDEGPTKCDAADPQITTLQWEWYDNETKLAFISGWIGNDQMEVLELSATTLRLRLEKRLPSANLYVRSDWTYVAQ